MKENHLDPDSPPRTSRRAHTPRLEGQQFESVHVRLPKPQVQALTEIAAHDFRSLPDQLAYVVWKFLIEREADP
jgi:hypothetical protein